MTLLVVGGSGFVGRHVCRRAVALGLPVVGTYARRPLDIDGVDWRRLDITEPAAVEALARDVGPAAIVSSAYAAAPSLSPITASVNWATNALGAVTVARAAATVGARLVHASSDALFRGRPAPHTERDVPDPTYAYGAAKAAAELAIAQIMPSAALARISLINSDGGGGDLSPREQFMIDLAARRATGVLFTDDIRCPIAVSDVASALLELAMGAAGGGSPETLAFGGVINLAGTDAVSFYELGVLVALRHGLDPAALPASTIADSGVVRPGNILLDASLAASLLHTRLRGIREVLA